MHNCFWAVILREVYVFKSATTMFGNADIPGCEFENSIAYSTIDHLVKHKDSKTKIFVGLLDIWLNNLVDLGKVH